MFGPPWAVVWHDRHWANLCLPLSRSAALYGAGSVAISALACSAVGSAGAAGGASVDDAVEAVWLLPQAASRPAAAMIVRMDRDARKGDLFAVSFARAEAIEAAEGCNG